MTKFEELTDIIARKKNKIDKNSEIDGYDELEVFESFLKERSSKF